MLTPSKPRRRCRLRRASSASRFFQIQPRHLRILLLLYHIRYATAEILAILYEAGGSTGSKRVRNDLGDLYHAGYAARWHYPSRSAGFGSEQYVYAITPRGARAILPNTLYARESSSLWHRSQPKAPSTIPHRLAISELHTIFAVGCSDTPRMERFYRDHAHELRIKVRLSGHDGTTTIQPDAGVVFQWPDGRRTLFLVEIDLTHRNRARAVRRFQAYHAYLTSRDAELKSQFHVDGAALLFVADSHDRADHLRRLAQDVFAQTPRRRRPSIFFWGVECWHEIAMVADGRYMDARPRRVMRPPGAILDAPTVRTLDGRARQLFPQHRLLTRRDLRYTDPAAATASP